MPDLINRFIEGGTAGTSHTAGLPNITGYTAWAVNGVCENTYSSQKSVYNVYSGALWCTKDGGAYGAIGASGEDSANTNTRVNIDASRSSSVYGNSLTVQPASLEINILIKY